MNPNLNKNLSQIELEAVERLKEAVKALPSNFVLLADHSTFPNVLAVSKVESPGTGIHIVNIKCRTDLY